jgi:hypothetical protein
VGTISRVGLLVYWFTGMYYYLSISSIQFNSIQFNSIQFNSVQFSSIQLNPIQLNPVQFSSVNQLKYVPSS